MTTAPHNANAQRANVKFKWKMRTVKPSKPVTKRATINPPRIVCRDKLRFPGKEQKGQRSWQQVDEDACGKTRNGKGFEPTRQGRSERKSQSSVAEEKRSVRLFCMTNSKTGGCPADYNYPEYDRVRPRTRRRCGETFCKAKPGYHEFQSSPQPITKAKE